MARGINFIKDINKFQLSGPPSWFLDQLWEFDPSLVIVPSRQGFYYRLAQRRKLKLPENVVNDVLKEQSDTRMLASYSLVPVTTILSTANWSSPIFFTELRRRAPWRMGGAKKFTQLVEGQEREAAMAQRIAQDEHLDYLSKDAWKYYNKLTGLRSHLYSPKTKSTAPVSRGIRRVKTEQYRPQLESAWGDVLRRR